LQKEENKPYRCCPYMQQYVGYKTEKDDDCSDIQYPVDADYGCPVFYGYGWGHHSWSRGIKKLNNKNTNCFNIDLVTCKFLGQGQNGKVYLLPNGNVLKIFFKADNCKHEYEILKSVEGNKHFPKVYEYSSNCILREYIDGILIKNYISKHGLCVKLAKNLIELIEDFKDFGFTRLDIRCEHIFIQQDLSIKIIDPRRTYTKVISYPHSILKSLNKLGVLDIFFNTLKKTNIKLYRDWSKKYIYDKKNDIHY